MFVLPVFMYLVVPVFVLPVLLLWVFFMRRVDHRAGVLTSGYVPIVISETYVTGTGGVVTVTSFEGFTSAGEKMLGNATVRIPDSLMVFSDLDEMQPFRSGTMADLAKLLGNQKPVCTRELICPVVEFFTDGNHRLRRGFPPVSVLKGYRDCFREIYGYSPDGFYARTVNFFGEKPEAWVPFTAASTIVLGVATFIFGTWLTVAKLIPLTKALLG